MTEHTLVPIGDIHYGYTCCNIKKLNKVIEYVKAKDNRRWIAMGDLIDNTSPKNKYFNRDQHSIDVQRQILDLAKMFEPIADKCLGLLWGNHEARAFKEEFNPNLQLAALLGNEKLDLGSSNHLFKYAGKNVFACHGLTMSRNKSYKIKQLLELDRLVDADLYLMGHVHELDFVRDFYIKNGLNQERLYVFTGHFLEYQCSRKGKIIKTYANEKLMKPIPTGCNAIHINGKFMEVERIV